MDSSAANKLYVGNLAYSVTSEQLKEFFAEFGEVVEAIVITDKMSGRSKGFGFVTFASDEEAKKALEMSDGKEMAERNLRVSIARPLTR
ncbi:MAG: RNA recognition motif domain-containing protein [Patescibacteria group bacterium]